MTEEEFFKILESLQESSRPKPLIYRLYHDQDGWPLFYSMENLPGQYVDVDQKTYQENSSHVRVVNGKVVRLRSGETSKLVPSDQGTSCDPRDICIVVDETHPHIKWRNANAD